LGERRPVRCAFYCYAELFDLRHLGIIVGITGFWGTIGGAIGVPLAGTIFDINGSYSLAFYICITLGVLAVSAGLILLRTKNRQNLR